MTTITSSTPAEQVVNGAKLIADVSVLPGSSLLVDGKIVEGGAHAIAGVVAARLIGPVGWVLVAANSYSKATSGQSLYSHVSGLWKSKKRSSAEASPTAASEAA